MSARWLRRSRLSLRGRDIIIRPLSPRGQMLTQILEPVLAPHPHWESFTNEGGVLHGHLKPLPELFSEEERSKQPSAFSVVRALIDEFHHPLSARLALVGAFGYDLLLQFDPIERSFRAMTSKTCICSSATTSTSWIARRSDRALPIRFCARRS